MGGRGAAARAGKLRPRRRGVERGERMFLQRARELAGLAAGEARKVWGGEENPVSRGKSSPSGVKGGGGEEGDHFVLAPSRWSLGCHGGGKGEERGPPLAAAGLVAGRTSRLSHTPVSHSFIHPLRAGRTPRRMPMSLDPVLKSVDGPKHFFLTLYWK